MTKRSQAEPFFGLSARDLKSGRLCDAESVRLLSDGAVESLGAALDCYPETNDTLLPGVYTTAAYYDADCETPVTRDWLYTHIAPADVLDIKKDNLCLRFLVADTELYGKNENGYRRIVGAFCDGDALCVLYHAVMNVIDERSFYEVSATEDGTAVVFDASRDTTAGSSVSVRTLTQLWLDRYTKSGRLSSQLIAAHFYTHKTFTAKNDVHRTLVMPKGGSFHYVTDDYLPDAGAYIAYRDLMYTLYYPTLAADYPYHFVGYTERIRKAGFRLRPNTTDPLGISRRAVLFTEMLSLQDGSDGNYIVESLAADGKPCLYAGVQHFGRLFGFMGAEIYATRDGTISDYASPTVSTDESDPAAPWCDSAKGADAEFTAIASFGGKILAFTKNSMLTVKGQALPFELSYVGAFGCLSQEALAAHGKYLYFVSSEGVMRYDGSRVLPLDAPLPCRDFTGAALTVADGLLLLYVPGCGGLYLYDTVSESWSFRAEGDGVEVLFPGNTDESDSFADIYFRNAGGGFRPCRLFGAPSIFAFSTVERFTGRRRLAAVSVTASLAAGARLELHGASGRVLHTFTGDGKGVRTYHAALRNVYFDDGKLSFSGSGKVRIYGISVLYDEVGDVRRRLNPEKQGGNET